jgi:hypothetical protein
MTLDELLAEIGKEECRATMEQQPFVNSHQGLAAIWQPFNRLRNVVAAEAPLAEMREEAIQVAAMAARFVLDVCEEKNEIT